MCDCPRIIDNEFYWHGSSCVPASSYNGICHTNYMCQTLTQGTSCISSKCTCDDSKIWSTVLSKCVLNECVTGWKRYGNKCYKSFSESIKWNEAKSKCEEMNYNLASVSNKTIFDFLLQGIVLEGKHWVGAWRANNSYYWMDNSPFTSFNVVKDSDDPEKNYMLMENEQTKFFVLTISDSIEHYMCEYTIGI
jgi:hypothetical protein